MLPLSACSMFNKDDDQPAQGAPGVLYERARRSLDNQDFDGSIRVYEALVARYPFAAETRQARLDLDR